MSTPCGTSLAKHKCLHCLVAVGAGLRGREGRCSIDMMYTLADKMSSWTHFVAPQCLPFHTQAALACSATRRSQPCGCFISASFHTHTYAQADAQDIARAQHVLSHDICIAALRMLHHCVQIRGDACAGVEKEVTAAQTQICTQDQHVFVFQRVSMGT